MFRLQKELREQTNALSEQAPAPAPAAPEPAPTTRLMTLLRRREDRAGPATEPSASAAAATDPRSRRRPDTRPARIANHTTDARHGCRYHEPVCRQAPATLTPPPTNPTETSQHAIFRLPESRKGGRRSNQDRMGYCFTRDALLMVLADGLGGHALGEVAAQQALQTLAHQFRAQARPAVRNPADFLQDSIMLAHRQIHRYAEAKRLPDIPRTTVVCCPCRTARSTGPTPATRGST